MLVKFLIVIGSDFCLRILDIFFDRRINAIFFWKLLFRSTFFVKFQLFGHSIIQRSRWQWNSLRIPNKFLQPIAHGLDNQSNAFIDCYWQNGELDLTFYIYRLSFLNFLLGKQANGPGQYLFGTVTPETPTCMFPIGKYKDLWRNGRITQNWPWPSWEDSKARNLWFLFPLATESTF